MSVDSFSEFLKAFAALITVIAMTFCRSVDFSFIYTYTPDFHRAFSKRHTISMPVITRVFQA